MKHFFEYLDQVHAHDYYTDKLWKDNQSEPLVANHPDIVKQMASVMLQQRTENKYWPAVANSRASKKKKK